MSIEIQKTIELVKVIETIKPVPTFFRLLGFGTQSFSTAKQIILDKIVDKARVTPFSHPNSKASLVEKLSYDTNSVSPAYLKDKRAFVPSEAQVRPAGTAIGIVLSPMAIMAQKLRNEFADQIRMLGRRIEVMCAEALLYGTQTFKGEGFDGSVSFLRDAGNAYSAPVAWDHLTGAVYDADIASDFQTAAGIISLAGGGFVRAIMDPLAYALFQKNAMVRDVTSAWISSGRLTSSLIDPKIFEDGAAQFAGMYGTTEVWVYNFSYVDPYDNTTKKIMPDKTCLFVGSNVQGIQHFGMVQNFFATDLPAMEYFPHMWAEGDGSAKFIQLESAPLMQPGIVNATVTLTVAT